MPTMPAESPRGDGEIEPHGLLPDVVNDICDSSNRARHLSCVRSSIPVPFTAETNAGAATMPTDAHSISLPPMTIRETAREAMNFCLLWFVANYFSNAALQYTNVPSFTIISSMSGFFTLFLGVCVGVEKFAWIKLGALIISYRPCIENI